MLLTVENEGPTGYPQGPQKSYLFNVFLRATLNNVAKSKTQNMFIIITQFIPYFIFYVHILYLWLMGFNNVYLQICVPLYTAKYKQYMYLVCQ